MTNEEFKNELSGICRVAKEQSEGGYSAESDAITALVLIRRLSAAILESAKESPK